jgi:hypothetical protein
MTKKYHNGKLINLSSTSKYLGGMPSYKPRHKKIQIGVKKAPVKPTYRIPKTPKESGIGWGP